MSDGRRRDSEGRSRLAGSEWLLPSSVGGTVRACLVGRTREQNYHQPVLGFAPPLGMMWPPALLAPPSSPPPLLLLMLMLPLLLLLLLLLMAVPVASAAAAAAAAAAAVGS